MKKKEIETKNENDVEKKGKKFLKNGIIFFAIGAVALIIKVVLFADINYSPDAEQTKYITATIIQSLLFMVGFGLSVTGVVLMAIGREYLKK